MGALIRMHKRSATPPALVVGNPTYDLSTDSIDIEKCRLSPVDLQALLAELNRLGQLYGWMPKSPRRGSGAVSPGSGLKRAPLWVRLVTFGQIKIVAGIQADIPGLR